MSQRVPGRFFKSATRTLMGSSGVNTFIDISGLVFKERPLISTGLSTAQETIEILVHVGVRRIAPLFVARRAPLVVAFAILGFLSPMTRD